MGDVLRGALFASFVVVAGCGSAPSASMDAGSDASGGSDVGADAADAASLAVDAGHDAFAAPDAAALLTISPTPFSFGTTVAGGACGAPLTQTFTVTNAGGAGVDVIAASIGGLDATQFVIDRDGCTGVALAPAASCTIDVAYRPSSVGDHSAILDVVATGGEAHAALTGRGLAPAVLQVLPATRNFGTVVVGSMSTSIDFTVRNVGGCDLPTLTSSVSGADADEFQLVSSTCDGAPLAGGASCAVTVVFAPTRSGSATAVLDVTAGTLTASSFLTATGLPSENHFVINPVAHDFGTTSLGCADGAPVTFSILNPSGSAADVTSVAIAGTNPADFVVVRDGCTGATLAPGASCTVDVAFRPTAVGVRGATLTVNGSASTGSADLTGSASSPPALAVTPAAYAYGTVVVGATASADFTVTNTCAVRTTGVLTIVITGIAAGQFRIAASTCEGVMLAGGASCVVTVAFEPTATGPATAVLDVSSPTGGRDTADLGGVGG